MKKNKDYYNQIIEKAKTIITTIDLIEKCEPVEESIVADTVAIYGIKEVFEPILGKFPTVEETKEMRSQAYQILTNRLKHQQADLEAFKQQNEQK